MVTCR